MQKNRQHHLDDRGLSSQFLGLQEIAFFAWPAKQISLPIESIIKTGGRL